MYSAIHIQHADQRLVRVGKQSAFAYDGLGRRIAITNTPAGGGSTVTTAYLWCGERICQARNSGNTTTRSYYAEGEFVPGTPAYRFDIEIVGNGKPKTPVIGTIDVFEDQTT